MTPPKRYHLFNKHLMAANEKVALKEGPKPSKTKLKKKKLSGMLGSRWNKEELRMFYEAFRKYGKDWKKAASLFRKRSIDMVEALYKMNKAYLSLPEGKANVSGLIAMMSDYYDNLDGGNGGQERKDSSKLSFKLPKNDCGRIDLHASKGLHEQDLLHPSECRCLFLLRESPDRFARYNPRPVGKRTPRFPVIYTSDIDDKPNASSPANSHSMDSGSLNGVAHLAILALAEISPGGSLQQVSQKSVEIADMEHHPVSNAEREPELDSLEIGFGDCYPKELGSIPEGAHFVTKTKASDTEVMCANEARLKVQKLMEGLNKLGRNRPQYVEAIEVFDSTKGGLIVEHNKDEDQYELPDEKTRHKNKRQRKKESGYNNDALHTLAEISLCELSLAPRIKIGLHEEAIEADAAQKSDVIGKVKKNNINTDVRSPNRGDGRKSACPGDGLASPSCAKYGEQICTEVTQQVDSCSNKAQNIRHRSSSAGKVSVEDAKRRASRQLSSSCMDEKHVGINSAEPALQDCPINMPARGSRRRKMSSRAILNKNICRKLRRNVLNGNASDPMVRFSSCLSSQKLRRWCVFEWFYSAIDYPWFCRSEFIEYLNHVQLGHVQKLTQIEWSVVRSSLGRPRRFSKQFLLEERKSLELYRESVRQHYSDLRAGSKEGLPTDLARPLSVGQLVMALHPKTREVHLGSVLSVDYKKCRVQFDKADLGVELVLDIDCMPLHPWENFPEDLRRNHAPSSKLHNPICSKETDNHLESLNTADLELSVLSSTYAWSPFLMQPEDMAAGIKTSPPPPVDSGACTQAESQELEGNIQALVDLARIIPKHEVLLAELRQMSTDMCRVEICGALVKNSENVKHPYTTVYSELQETSNQVNSALQRLTQHGAYQGNMTTFFPTGGMCLQNLNSFNELIRNSESHPVVDIIQSSRKKARKMVDMAVQEMSAIEGGDANLRIAGCKSCSIEHRSGCFSSQVQSIYSIFPEHINSGCQDQADASCFERANERISSNASPNLNEHHLPSKLISECVATYMMIQRCTERQIPPADIAQILDTALASLQPRCKENLTIYRDIETYMGIIKNQVLALVPIASGGLQVQISV